MKRQKSRAGNPNRLRNGLGGIVFACITASLSLPVVIQPVLGAEQEQVRVNVNMARILRISSPAATVIVGNPGVADVTIQDPQTLILTGRSYGNTNLIILDGVGNPIADMVIEVAAQQAGLMTVYQGAARTTLSCAPNCQPVIMLGDDTSYTTDTISSSSLVAGAAN